MRRLMATIVTGATVVATLGAGAMGVVAAVGPADDTLEVREVAPITIVPSPTPEPETTPAPQTTPTDAPAVPPAEVPAPQPAPVAPEPTPAPAQAPAPVEVAPEPPHEIGDRADWSRYGHDRYDGDSSWTHDDDHDHDGDRGWYGDGGHDGGWNDDDRHRGD